MDNYTIDKLNQKLKNNESLFKEIHYFSILDSTNSHIKKNLESYDTGDIILADMQTEGRGRQGRRWFSSPGEGLYFSILLKNNWNLKKLNFSTLVIATSIDKALKDLGYISKIKWPNDIYINDRKVAGVLVENIINNFNNTIIGIGININNKCFSSEISKTATSLYLESGSILRERVLYSILTNLHQDIISYTDDFNTEPFVQYIRSNSLYLNKKITITVGNKKIHGILTDILMDGSIVISDRKDNIHIMNYCEIINP